MVRGRRRIDRVLAPGYLDGMEALPMEEVRALREKGADGRAIVARARPLVA